MVNSAHRQLERVTCRKPHWLFSCEWVVYFQSNLGTDAPLCRRLRTTDTWLSSCRLEGSCPLSMAVSCIWARSVGIVKTAATAIREIENSGVSSQTLSGLLTEAAHWSGKLETTSGARSIASPSMLPEILPTDMQRTSSESLFAPLIQVVNLPDCRISEGLDRSNLPQPSTFSHPWRISVPSLHRPKIQSCEMRETHKHPGNV